MPYILANDVSYTVTILLYKQQFAPATTDSVTISDISMHMRKLCESVKTGLLCDFIIVSVYSVIKIYAIQIA